MKTMRIIQCGVGGFGGGWLGVVQRNEQFEHAALVDPNSANMEAARRKVPMPASLCFTSLDRALAKVKADAVLVVTPPATHHPLVVQALSAGTHVLVEKPIAEDMPSAMDMVRQAELHKRILMVSQNYRNNPAPHLLRTLLAKKNFGRLVHADIVFALAADFRGSFRETMQYPLLLDMSIHHTDLMRYITGLEAKSIYVRSIHTGAPEFKHDAAFKAVIEMENGVVLGYSGDWTARRLATSWNGDWQIQTRKGALAWDDSGVTFTTSLPWGKERSRRFLDVPGLPATGQDYSLTEFGRAIREGDQPETSGKDNIRSFAMVQAALESCRLGTVVQLKDILSASR